MIAAAPAVALPPAADAVVVPARRVVAPLVCCLAAQLVAALALIPPWQNPDEPQHLLTARLVQARGSDFTLQAVLGGADERAIIESMAQHGWWRHYSEPTPDPLPATFADGPAKVVATYFGPPSGGSRLYYRGVASLFTLTGIESVIGQLYAMRVLSVIAALLTIGLAWSGTRVLLGDRAATVVAAGLALHPQFIFVSSTASPDAWVNLAGAIVWRQSALLLTAPELGVKDLAILWLAAAGAFVLRRLGAPLLCAAGAVTAILAWRELRRPQAPRGAAAWATAAVVLLAIAAPLLATDLTRAVDGVRFELGGTLSIVASRASELPAFLDMLFRTFWVAAGWLRYPAPGWLNAVTVAIAVVALAGLRRAIGKGRGAERTAAALSVGLIAVQLLAVVIYHFGILQSGPQGRYMFPVLTAVFCLLWIGWDSTVRAIARRPEWSAASLIFVMALLNTSAWLFVVLPAFT